MTKFHFLEQLGLFGWNKLEPVIIAALASEEPILLIGKHGSAKSYLLERLAEISKLEYRCYNASLINYDDLVGIPIPVNNNTSLSYISNSTSIWDAEVVFVDEINRTKPELQNKLFPIIYDRRIQGVKLEKLKYRWAAMNPAYIDEEDDEISYFGAMPLDIALADRFSFIVSVPTRENLTKEQKEKMLLDSHEGKSEVSIDLNLLINHVKEEYQKVIQNDENKFIQYTINLMTLLENSFNYASSRRATILENTLIYIYSAYKVLNSTVSEVDCFKESAYLHIQNTLPFIVNKKVDTFLLLNICKQALEISNLKDSEETDILLLKDPVERLKNVIIKKDIFTIDKINQIVPKSLSEIDDPKERRAMALFSYLAFRSESKIHASIIETLINETKSIFSTGTKIKSFIRVSEQKVCKDALKILENLDKTKPYYNYLFNYVCSLFPNSFSNSDDVKSTIRFFIETWEELHL